MSIKDLIDEIEYTDVQKSMERYYNADKNEQFRKLYELLRTLSPQENKDSMTLDIRVFERVGGRNNKRIEEYNEHSDERDGKKLYFDVYGIDDFYDNDLVYSICRVSYNRFLGFYVNINAFKEFTKASLLAHFLWALCEDDFDERRAL